MQRILKFLALFFLLIGAQGRFSSVLEASDWGSTLLKIQATGLLRLGYDPDAAPMAFLSDTRRPIGYVIDLCQDLSKSIQTALGLKKISLEWIPVPTNAEKSLIAAGAVDIHCGPTVHTRERESALGLGFSVRFFLDESRVLLRAPSSVKNLKDLQGKSIISTAGTATDRFLRLTEVTENLDFKNILGKDHAETFRRFEAGESDALALDGVLLAGFLSRQKQPERYFLADFALPTQFYALSFRKNEPDLKKILDTELVAHMRSGRSKELYRRWFESPVPPRQISLQRPLPEVLQQFFLGSNDDDL